MYVRTPLTHVHAQTISFSLGVGAAAQVFQKLSEKLGEVGGG